MFSNISILEDLFWKVVVFVVRIYQLQVGQNRERKLSALQWTCPEWLSCVWFLSSWLTPVCHTASLPFPIHYFLLLHRLLQWSFFPLSLNIPHPFLHSLSSYPPSPSLICFLSLLLLLSLFLSLSLTSWGNTIDISPTWLPDTASTPFLLHPSSLPQSFSFTLLPPLAFPPRLRGVKAKQKLAPDLAEVIGIKLQWKWKCR